LIMTAHVQYSQLDSSGNPATLSSNILTEILRNELNYKGVIVSDSLLMEGVKQQTDNEGDLAIAAINAGVDLLLDVADPVATLASLEKAVSAGPLQADRVEEAFDRDWNLKRMVFEGNTPRSSNPEEGEEAAIQLAERAARGAVTVVNNTEGMLPLSKEKSLLAVLLKPFTTSLDDQEQPLASALRSRFDAVNYFELGPESDEALTAKILKQAESAEQVLVAMIVKPAAWHRFGLSEEHATLTKALLMNPNCVLVSLGTREAFDPFPEAKVQICTFSDVPVSQRALVEALV
ncbi:MAG: glycoside hydrolase family 3 N-terminal domain-containing protein, partial [Lacipirellulaceae bacterium]